MTPLKSSPIAPFVRRSFIAMGAGALLTATLALRHADEAQSQQASAKVEQVDKVYCRYRDSVTNKDKTGVATGIRSCDAGDGNRLVSYTPCGEPATELPRKQLKRSEVDCNGQPPPSGDFAVEIKGRIVSISDDSVIVSYETNNGAKTFALKKTNLFGVYPELDRNVTFSPTNVFKKTDPALLAKEFEKFKVDANRTTPQPGLSIVSIVK
jgi:hypothetical protein